MWRNPTTTTTRHPLCTAYTLPAGIVVLPSTTQTITHTAVFSPKCSSTMGSSLLSESTTSASLREPFYSSVVPILYTVAGATVLSWVLLILLLVTPQRRPYLQKIATLTVAVSLTVAMAEATKILRHQYDYAYEDTEELRNYIDNGTTLQIFRIVSDLFLWLAQVQTLIRLFPRQREKKIIKWLGLVLILIDTVFWSLKSFLPTGDDDESFRDAVPALAYLFQITLSVLYCAYVVYYSISKRVYAYHVKNLFLASLSLTSVLTPIIFFLLDVSREYISGWGDFVRWVGGAAASVVVWEWVERIEYLESKDQESGVLGRQVFEDEMLEIGTSRGARAGRHSNNRTRRSSHRRGPRRGWGGDNRPDVGSAGDGGGSEGSNIAFGFLSRIRGMTQRGESSADPELGQMNTAFRMSESRSSQHRIDQNSNPVINEDSVDQNSAYLASGEPDVLDQEKDSMNDTTQRVPSDGGPNNDRAVSDGSPLSALSSSTPISSSGRLGVSRFGFADRLTNGLFSWFDNRVFGRPLSRTTTGTSATSYRVDRTSMGDEVGAAAAGHPIHDDNLRVKHVYPLRRGLSRSTDSSSPQSFTNGGALGTTTNRSSPTAGQSSSTHVTIANNSNSHTRQSPVPSVSFRENVIRRTGNGSTATAAAQGSSLSRTVVDDADDEDEDLYDTDTPAPPGATSSSLNELIFPNQDYASASSVRNAVEDDEDEDDDDDEFDYIVSGDPEPDMLVGRSLLAQTVLRHDNDENTPSQPPPAFERIPGFNDGDYWDEKARPPSLGMSGSSGPSGSSGLLVSHTPGRATLAPADGRTSRRIVERVTGKQDWIVRAPGPVSGSQ
ncbi:PalH/RIM21-domain-containing protein [Lipomyces oligophaga]|uniref:PalH/RIM21-domain-containing protein n=1 Tax=Lipomyces oligophaga TaxID=45792 RepID=UPI0034CD42AB